MLHRISYKFIHTTTPTIEFLRSKASFLISLIFLPVLIVHFLLWPFIRVRFVKLREDRIGHLAGNTELFLRRLDLGLIKEKRTVFIFLASSHPVNSALFAMYAREMRIIRLPPFLMKYVLSFLFYRRSILVMSGMCINLQYHFKSNEFFEFNKGPNHIHLTPSEERKGKALLAKMGVRSWFVCFHARDPEYVSATYSLEEKELLRTPRDCDIATYLPACDYIASQKGYAVRMGSKVAAPLPVHHPRIIDYASRYRSEFGDIYLVLSCKFFLGNTSGICFLSSVYHKPLAAANLIPLKYSIIGEKDIFIPKKLYSLKKRRLLNFKEIIGTKIETFVDWDSLRQHHIRLIDNTPEEILDLAKEMNERIDGTFVETAEDRMLQERFRSYFKKDHYSYGYTCRIGTLFLRKNKKLFPP